MHLPLLLAVSGLCCGTGLGFAQAPRDSTAALQEVSVRATGSAVLDASLPVVRERATEAALRAAVEQAAGVLISSTTVVRNHRLLEDRIYSRASGFVRRYELVAEAVSQEILSVTIDAWVGTNDLASDLAAIGLLIARASYPRLLLAGSSRETGAGALAEQFVLERLAESLKQRGVPVIEPRTSGNGSIRPPSPDILMTIQLGLDPIMEVGGGIVSRSGSLTIVASESGTGKAAVRFSTEATVPGPSSARATRALGMRLADDALQGVLSQLLASWTEEVDGAGQALLVVGGLESATQYYRVLGRLKELIASRSSTVVVERTLDVENGVAYLDLQRLPDLAELAQLVQRSQFTPDRVVVRGLSRAVLRLELLP